MTAIKPASRTCRILAKAYPNQARNLTGGPISIRVDDRDGDDIYAGFCDIHLEMSDPEAGVFRLILDNVPVNDEVKAVATALGGSWKSTRTGEQLVLELSLAEAAEEILWLSQTIRHVVAKGNRYLDPNWKWVAPRTAKSLKRLASIASRLRPA